LFSVLKNDPCDVRNYRGITLVCCLSKIFTSVVKQRPYGWVKNKDILLNLAFARVMSTVGAIFVLNAIVNVSERGRL